MDTPKPLVIKPMISSPGRGLQQRESFVRQLSIPSTSTPPDTFFAFAGALTTAGGSWGRPDFAMRWYSSRIRGMTFQSCTPP